eukprot:13592912-Alexandrium_andersonii.AAC.1
MHRECQHPPSVGAPPQVRHTLPPSTSSGSDQGPSRAFRVPRGHVLLALSFALVSVSLLLPLASPSLADWPAVGKYCSLLFRVAL